MNITRRNPFINLESFLNGHYQPVKSAESTATTKIFTPKVDIYENEDHYHLIAELAGFSKEKINVTVNDSILTIEADNRDSQSTEDGAKPTIKLLRKERYNGKLSRSFNLGQNIDQAEIKAEFKDGLLSLVVPKVKEVSVQPRRINIH